MGLEWGVVGFSACRVRGSFLNRIFKGSLKDIEEGWRVLIRAFFFFIGVLVFFYDRGGFFWFRYLGILRLFFYGILWF